MTEEKAGPRTRRQLKRLASVWQQGEHVVISGGTGSGKTSLGRFIDQIRLDRGGHVIVFIAKLAPDQTVTDNYKGWERWTKFHKNAGPNARRILLWPDVSKGKDLDEKKAMQRAVFKDAINQISIEGKWTVDFDEGLYMCSPEFMNLGSDIAMLHALGRSSKITIITKMQRPANVPLIIYSSAAHAFIGRVREASDLKRLSELGGNLSAKEIQARLSGQGRRDFLWIPVAPDWPPETVNLRR